MVPGCLMWPMWKERNRRTYGDQGLSLQGIKSQLIGSLFYWLSLDYSRPPMFYDSIDSVSLSFCKEILCLQPVYFINSSFVHMLLL